VAPARSRRHRRTKKTYGGYITDARGRRGRATIAEHCLDGQADPEVDWQ
jgi:hypothetical protein